MKHSLNMSSNSINTFRKVSVAEGISFLVLLIIAMPLKYMFDFPWAVKVVGWAHGVLFVAYIFLLLKLTLKLKWGIERFFMFFVAALLPLAPFFVDKQLAKESED